MLSSTLSQTKSLTQGDLQVDDLEFLSHFASEVNCTHLDSRRGD